MSAVEVAAPVTAAEPRIPFAWKSVSAIALAVLLTLVATLAGYGYTMDEFYFIAAGREADWGYADQPPLVPLIAAAMDALYPGSVFALRLPGALVVAAGVVVAAWIAREMGGRPRAQILAAAAYAIAFLNHGEQLNTEAFDVVLWMLASWLVIRWVRLRRDALLVWAGVVTAVALQVKFLIPVFWVALAVSVLVVGPREVLRRRALWAGAAIAVLITAPTLVWQAANGWPQVAMAGALPEENALLWGGQALFVPWLLLMAGIPIGTLLACYGLWKLLRSPDLREFRFLGWTAVGVVVVVFASGGRFSYVAGLFPLVFAAALVQLQLTPPARWWGWAVTWPVFALSALLPVAGLPLEPASTIKQPGSREEMRDNLEAFIQLGWPEFTASIARVHQALPPAERQGSIIVTQLYWQAAVVEVLGGRHGLPEAYSPHRGYGYLAVPPEKQGSVIYVGSNERQLRQLFGQVRRAGTVEGRVGMAIGTPIWVCGDRFETWARIWPRLMSVKLH